MKSFWLVHSVRKMSVATDAYKWHFGSLHRIELSDEFESSKSEVIVI